MGLPRPRGEWHPQSRARAGSQGPDAERAPCPLSPGPNLSNFLPSSLQYFFAHACSFVHLSVFQLIDLFKIYPFPSSSKQEAASQSPGYKRCPSWWAPSPRVPKVTGHSPCPCRLLCAVTGRHEGSCDLCTNGVSTGRGDCTRPGGWAEESPGVASEGAGRRWGGGWGLGCP